VEGKIKSAAETGDTTYQRRWGDVDIGTKKVPRQAFYLLVAELLLIEREKQVTSSPRLGYLHLVLGRSLLVLQ
jgi:hypothetical protein